MLSIGQLSAKTGVKVPTIRYYESIGIIGPVGRSAGNQRRYGQAELDRLRFVRHARDLGFGLDAISVLTSLQDTPDRPCAEAGEIAQGQLADIRRKIQQLTALEAELSRIAGGCNGTGNIGNCYVLDALAHHTLCSSDHSEVSGLAK